MWQQLRPSAALRSTRSPNCRAFGSKEKLSRQNCMSRYSTVNALRLQGARWLRVRLKFAIPPCFWWIGRSSRRGSRRPYAILNSSLRAERNEAWPSIRRANATGSQRRPRVCRLLRLVRKPAISRRDHAASVSAAHASRTCRQALCKARFRWMANPCREGIEPSGFH